MIAMKKHTYSVPAIKTIQVRTAQMIAESYKHMRYNPNNVGTDNAQNAASRGASNWDDE